MPRSILLGRPMPRPGEPLFTDEDTAYALALAEEEAATCPSCGLLKVVCRDPDYQFAFEPHEEQCHATRALADRQATWKDWSQVQQVATQLTVRFREGKEPALDVGLDLEGGEPQVSDSPA